MRKQNVTRNRSAFISILVLVSSVLVLLNPLANVEAAVTKADVQEVLSQDIRDCYNDRIEEQGIIWHGAEYACSVPYIVRIAELGSWVAEWGRTKTGEAFAALEDLDQAESLISRLKVSTALDDALADIRSVAVNEFDTGDLNRILSAVDETAFNVVEKAALKREVIQKAGFNNFDWRGTLDDVIAFDNLKIDVIELDSPIVLYRRGYPGEPSSKYGLGRWWGDKYRTVEQVRIELAVCENWGNPLTGEYKITLPEGTKILKGTAAPQTIRNAEGEILESRSGGGVQYFLNDVNNAWVCPN